jgi:hypothetical protein
MIYTIVSSEVHEAARFSQRNNDVASYVSVVEYVISIVAGGGAGTILEGGESEERKKSDKTVGLKTNNTSSRDSAS